MASKVKTAVDGNRLVDDVLRSVNFMAQSGMDTAVLPAVEFALWDSAGKALDLPVYRLLGGEFRHKIRRYRETAASRESPKKMAELAPETC